MTSPTDTPKRSDADLVKELHYIVLCHQPGSERRATLEAVCDMIERLSKPPSQGKVERAREIAHNIVSYCREHRSNTDVLTYTRDEAEEYVTAAITQALTEQGTGVETIGAAFRKWWREDCRFGMTETEALASFQEALPVSADGSRKAYLEMTVAELQKERGTIDMLLQHKVLGDPRIGVSFGPKQPSDTSKAFGVQPRSHRLSEEPDTGTGK